jgi:hypothetical protein
VLLATQTLRKWGFVCRIHFEMGLSRRQQLNKRRHDGSWVWYNDCIMTVWRNRAHPLVAYFNQLKRKNHRWKHDLCSIFQTPLCKVLLEKLTGFQLIKKSPAFYGTRGFITAVTSARHVSLFGASSTHSIPPHPTSWNSVLILSSNLCLGLPSGLFPSGFPNNTLYTRLLSPIRATCAAHLILDFIIRTILGEHSSSSLCSFLHSLELTQYRNKFQEYFLGLKAVGA